MNFCINYCLHASLSRTTDILTAVSRCQLYSTTVKSSVLADIVRLVTSEVRGHKY